jgi:hypothetical protein
MGENSWEMKYSLEVAASPKFVWNYWTNVSNWNDPPASFELHGTFASGASGLTHLPGQPPIVWYIREVTPGERATIEIPIEGAVLAFDWKFAQAAEGRTLISRRVLLRGEKAEAYLAFAKNLETTLPDGMKKLASAIESAAARQNSAMDDR